MNERRPKPLVRPSRRETPEGVQRRGAPRGNQNARTHGFYAHKLDPAEAKALKTADTYDLTEEISLLRLYMRRLVVASQDETNPEKLERTLRTLSLASIAVTRLFRAQVLAHPDAIHNESFAEEIGRIAAEVRQEIAARPDPPYFPDPGALQYRKQIGLVGSNELADDPDPGQDLDSASDPSSPSLALSFRDTRRGASASEAECGQRTAETPAAPSSPSSAQKPYKHHTHPCRLGLQQGSEISEADGGQPKAIPPEPEPLPNPGPLPRMDFSYGNASDSGW